MKRLMIIVLSITLLFCGCSSIETRSKEETVELVTTTAPVEIAPTEIAPAQSIPTVTLGITFDELVELIAPIQELNTTVTYRTDSFTIIKEGNDLSGIVCFAKPDNEELSTVFFLYGGNYGSIFQRMATESQNAVATYCKQMGLAVNVSKHENGSTSVLSVNAPDSGFNVEDLPISVAQFRSESAFLSDKVRHDTCQKLLEECRYSDLYEYISTFTSDNEIEEIDVVLKMQSSAEKLAELSVNCIITVDPVEKETRIQYATPKDIDANTNVVPIFSANSFGMSEEYKLGFRQSDWLFFDEISIYSKNLESQSESYDLWETNRDVLGGEIQEYVFSYLDVASYVDDEDVTIRFTNTEKREHIDHLLTDAELTAIRTLSEIKNLHSDIHTTIWVWDSM